MLDHGQDVHGDQRQQQPSGPFVDFVHDRFEPFAGREQGRQVDPSKPFRAVAGCGAVGPAADRQGEDQDVETPVGAGRGDALPGAHAVGEGWGTVEGSPGDADQRLTPDSQDLYFVRIFSVLHETTNLPPSESATSELRGTLKS